MNIYLKWLLPWIRAYDKFANFSEYEELFEYFKEKFEKEVVGAENRKRIIKPNNWKMD